MDAWYAQLMRPTNIVLQLIYRIPENSDLKQSLN
jgi:hypothetical protein